MKYVVIVGEHSGYQTHVGNVDNLDLPDSAEIYNDAEELENRLRELDSNK